MVLTWLQMVLVWFLMVRTWFMMVPTWFLMFPDGSQVVPDGPHIWSLMVRDCMVSDRDRVMDRYPHQEPFPCQSYGYLHAIAIAAVTYDVMFYF